jgi:hypothetical protein
VAPDAPPVDEPEPPPGGGSTVELQLAEADEPMIAPSVIVRRTRARKFFSSFMIDDLLIAEGNGQSDVLSDHSVSRFASFGDESALATPRAPAGFRHRKLIRFLPQITRRACGHKCELPPKKERSNESVDFLRRGETLSCVLRAIQPASPRSASQSVAPARL